MAKKYIKSKIILIFFFAFSFIKCDDDVKAIIYDFTNHYGEITKDKDNTSKSQSFFVDFSKKPTDIPFYIKVQVTSNDDNPAPLLFFSNTDPSCKTRDQIVKNPNGKSAFFWVKREQFEKSDEYLYIMAECEAYNCLYTIRVEGDQSAVFGPNFIYSYLVTSYNRNMKFEINGSEKNIYMTISLDGSSKATLEVESNYGVEKYKTGSTISIYLEDYEDINISNLAIINVKGGEIGEYLTLSAHIINITAQYEGVAQNGLILPNGGEITGFLEAYKFKEECFPIDLSDSRFNTMTQLYITGRIHTKYGWFFLEDENKEYLDETDTEINDGLLSFVMKNNHKLNYICFEIPDESTFQLMKMIFSFSITEPNSISNLFNYYPPQITGEIYKRLIPKGAIAFFSGTKNDNTALKYDYNIYQNKGVTKMYIGDCRTYPNCTYSESQLSIMPDPKNTNQMFIWTTADDKSSAIGNEKYVIVAHCLDDDNENNGFCEFETSIFSKGQAITLIENEKFSKFVISGETGSFIADFQEAKIIQRVTFDIMIFSGDVTFTVNENVHVNYDKYYLSNKIFIHFTLGQRTIDKIIIDYSAEMNSFFTIQYGMHSYNNEQLLETIPSGESYLMQIDPTYESRTKNIYFSNFFSKYKNEYLINFFEINCEFEVKRGDDTIIDFFDGYAQDIINSSYIDYDYNSYLYTIRITEPDLSNYNHKMCMMYVAGYESETNHDREIVVGDNINQQIIFKYNFKKVRFLYPLPDINKDIVVNINVIDKAFYNITIFSAYTDVKQTIITRSQKLYLKGSVVGRKCQQNAVCPVIVQVEFQSEIVKTDPMIEITIREIKNNPSYLQKGQAKLDFVCGDKIYYLYTDIGKNELGEITVNFLREFGNLWAKVVRKDQSLPDDNSNWRGIYRMPSEDWGDSLPFNGYTKKLFVSSEDTTDCIEGCYLLISIQISQIGDYVEDYKFYPFSIITRITPSNRAYTDVPKVVIQVDEFIIGNVDVAENEKIFEFFEIWLPHDSNIVLFDWQSSVAGLYINLGGIRPTTKIADFKLLPPGKDSILNLTKTEILEKAEIKKIKIPYYNSIQDINLVIGIWTDKTDSIDTEIYSLKVHLPDEDINSNLDIYEVNTDQKILCNPIRIAENEYRCLFVVTYDNEDVNMFTPLLVYGGSLNNGALSYIYANFIDRNIYDEYIKKDLINNIPTFQTATLNSKEEGVDYIFKSDLLKDKYVFINIMTDKPEPIIIVTSMPIYNYISYDIKEFYPNPSTEQLLSVSGDRLRLSFPCTESITVNIVTLNGHAELSWKNDPNTVFVVRGTGDRISLSSGSNADQLIIRKLGDSNNNNNKNLQYMENPGFAFYISYIIKDNDIRFNEITYGKSLEITYRDADLPVILYCKIGSEYNDVNIAITFKDNAIDIVGVHQIPPLKISAQLVKENIIYEAKKDSDLRPSDKEIKGNYDSAIRTAQVFLSEEIIKSFNIKDSDNPTIYIRIDKDEFGQFAYKTFEKFSIEAQVSGVNDGVIPVEKVYHYGRVSNKTSEQTVYRLKTDKNRPIMRIQIAFNSNNLDFVVSSNQNRRTNTTFLHSEKDRGKVYITLQINDNQQLYYLIIYKKIQKTDEILNNYAFKYINARYEYELFDYPILYSSELSISEENNEDEKYIISCTFNRLDIDKGKANITYFFKVVENSTYYYGEDINTIAVTESPYYTVYERNPEYNDKITLTARGDLSNWVYLNIIAQVQQNNIIEYISYNGKYFLRPNGKQKSGSNNLGLFLGIGAGLLVIVVGLVIAILIFYKKQKELLNRVKYVSFTKTHNNTDPNLLLQKSAQNSE